MRLSIAWMYLITHLISGTTTLVKDIKTVSNYTKLMKIQPFVGLQLLNNRGCQNYNVYEVVYIKIALISNQYLLFIFNTVEIGIKETILTPKLVSEKVICSVSRQYLINCLPKHDDYMTIYHFLFSKYATKIFAQSIFL